MAKDFIKNKDISLSPSSIIEKKKIKAEDVAYFKHDYINNIKHDKSASSLNVEIKSDLNSKVKPEIRKDIHSESRKEIKTEERKNISRDSFYSNLDFENIASRLTQGTQFTKKGLKSTGKAIVQGGRTAVSRTADSFIRYSPDIYEKHQDNAAGSLTVLSSLGIMTGRTMLRTKRSLQNRYHSYKAFHSSKNIENMEAELAELYNLKQNGADVDKRISTLLEHMHKEGVSRSIQLSKINTSRGISLIRSTKNTIGNQARKGLGHLANADDFGTKTIGKIGSAAYYSRRYRKTIGTMYNSAVNIAKSAIASLVGFITSIPAMIASLISLLPLLIVVFSLIAVLLPIIDLTVSGRVSVLADNIHILNELYDVNIEPEYVLAITDELNWTSGDIKNYERLYSIMLDQKKGTTPSFDIMIENVFKKYNPINYLKNSRYSSGDFVNIVFYSNTGLNTIGEGTQKLFYDDLIALYPDYKKNPQLYKENFSLKNAKKGCKESIDYNTDMYLKYMSTLSGFKAGASETGNQIAKIAISMSGHMYYWGGSGEIRPSKTSPSRTEEVFDCSGLVYYCHNKAGVSLGRSTANMYGKMGESIKYENLQAGDIITFDWGKDGVDDHIVIYIGNGNVIGAEGRGSGTYANDFDQCVKEWKLSTKRNSISKMKRLY